MSLNYSLLYNQINNQYDTHTNLNHRIQAIQKTIMKAIITFLVYALLVVGARQALANETANTNTCTMTEAVKYIESSIDGFKAHAYWDLDDGHRFKGRMADGSCVVVIWLEHTDKIIVHYIPRY